MSAIAAPAVTAPVTPPVTPPVAAPAPVTPPVTPPAAAPAAPVTPPAVPAAPAPSGLLASDPSTAAGTPAAGATSSAPAAAPAAPAAAPVPVEIKLPEGVAADPALLKEYGELAAKEGLDGGKASNLATWFLQKQADEVARIDTVIAAQHDTWGKEIAAKYGAKLPEAHDAARRFVRTAGAPFVGLLEQMGMTNHPVLFDVCAKFGEMLKEDNTGGGGGTPTPQARSADQKLMEMYPTMFNPDGTRK